MSTESLKELSKGVAIVVVEGAETPDDQLSDWQLKARGYHITLRYNRRKMHLDFWQGLGILRKPTAHAVLECLLSDASGADEEFEYWCDNYGYDSDSRKAEKIYKAVQIQTANLRKLLGDDFNRFINAERD